jgi:hypothetical protein
MSNWHAILYPIKRGTEEQVKALFRNSGSPQMEVRDDHGEMVAKLLSTMVFVGPGKALRVIEFDGALPQIIRHLRGQPAAARFQQGLDEYLDLPDGAARGPGFFRDAALRPVPLAGA